MEAALLGTIGQTSGVIGNLLGGIICDRLARRFGYHGRPLGAQISVTCGIPLMDLTLMGIPPGSSFCVYAMLLAAEQSKLKNNGYDALIKEHCGSMAVEIAAAEKSPAEKQPVAAKPAAKGLS